MSISSPGIGSGLDIGSLITQLVAAEGAATSARLTNKQAGFQTEISAFGGLSSALSTFQSAVQDLQNVTDFQVRSTSSSDTDVFTATASETADVAQYGIEVVQLAQAHKLITADGYADTDVIGGGTLTLTQGADSFNLTISGTDTLTDVRDAVNDATDNTGVAASIINVDDGLGGTEQKLTFTATSSGLDNAITITAVDDDTNHTDEFGLSRLVNAQLDTTAAALDGQIKVDNQTVSSDDNSFSGVIDGVTITAVSVGAGETLGITENKGAVITKINSFIDGYNELIGTVNALSSFDSTTNTAGILLGDSTLRGVENLIRREISSSVSGLTGTFSTLAELGVTTGEDGTLSLDSGTLEGALESSFDQVGEFFASTNGIANNLDSIIEGFIEFKGVIDSKTDGLQASIDRITEQREALDRRLESVQSRLLAQFTAMDRIVSSLRNQSDFLTQQLANLPGAFNPNSN